MAPLQKVSIDSREAFPRVIKVTPIPIEIPIHTRPILQSRPLNVGVNATLPYISSKPLNQGNFHWGTFILFLLMGSSLGVVLSKWGWRMITGQIWKWASGWKGPLPLEYEEEGLLPDSQPEISTSAEDSTIIPIVEEIPSSTDPEQMSPEEWIINHPRTI